MFPYPLFENEGDLDMAKLTINTGIKVLDIEDERGNVRGQISINTSDANLLPRAQTLVSNIENYLNEIDGAEQDAELVKAVDEKVKKEINVLFDDPNCSEVVFGNQNCLNTLNGVTFVERFLTAILPLIKDDIEAESKKSAEKISKYTSQVK